MFTATTKPINKAASDTESATTAKNRKPLAVIDIGSNSVRIRISDCQKVLYRDIATTQLSKGISDGILAYSSINRTLDGLANLISAAEKYNAEIHAFATAAVRNGKNGGEFVRLVHDKFGIETEVVSGEKESELGIIGALGKTDGTVLDVGGASSEIAVQKCGKIVYKHSLAIGAVTLTDICKKDYEKSAEFVKRKINEYGKVPCDNALCLIGGTATSLAFMLYGDREYDREKNHGRIIDLDRLKELTRKLFVLDEQDIIKEYNVNRKRADIIHSGALIILSVMEYLGKTSATVSENDNLEGYAKIYE